MSRPPELKDPVKLNLFVEKRTSQNAYALAGRALRKDPKASVSKIVSALINKAAREARITKAHRERARP